LTQHYNNHLETDAQAIGKNGKNWFTNGSHKKKYLSNALNTTGVQPYSEMLT
jgi:hypothetical protein